MTRLRITIHSHGPQQQAADYVLEALDVTTALAVADINVAAGEAEIWDGERCLARLSKIGAGQGTVWRVG